MKEPAVIHSVEKLENNYIWGRDEPMISKEHIKNNKPIILKWGKTLVDSTTGDVTDGVKHAPADEFLTRIDDEAKFVSLCRYIEMDGAKQKDIQHLRMNSPLMSMEKITTGAAYGEQVADISSLTEAVPTFLKQTLDAKPFTNYSIVPKTFLETNIEGEAFMNKMEGLMAPSTAYSMDQISIFGKRTLADSKGIHALKGVLAQLDDVATASVDTTTHELKTGVPIGKFGYYDDTTSGHDPAWAAITAGTGYEIIPQLEAMIEAFLKQKGKRDKAVFLISSIFEAKLLAEAGASRATDRSDYFRYDADGNFILHGIKFIALDVLNDPVNSYGDVVILCDPDAIGYAPVEDITSEGEYSVMKKAYVTSFDVFFDIAILFAQDVIYADVDYTPKA